MINLYYTKPNYVPNYVGGYFWWTWVQDCVLDPDANTIRAVLYADIAAQPR